MISACVADPFAERSRIDLNNGCIHRTSDEAQAAGCIEPANKVHAAEKACQPKL
jgi:hypothetical protein